MALELEWNYLLTNIWNIIFKPYPVPLQSSNEFLGLLLWSAASAPECHVSSPNPETSG